MRVRAKPIEKPAGELSGEDRKGGNLTSEWRQSRVVEDGVPAGE